MPILTWPSKALTQPVAASLFLDSVIFPGGEGYPLQAAPQDHIFLGDNLQVMAALLPEYENRLDLIYADPPFFTNKHYPARIGRGEDSRHPRDWETTEGYPDAWKDPDAYLDFLYPRLALMRQMLAPTGTLYLHLDWHADAYARLLLDELFGRANLINEIIWTYHGPSPIRRAFNRKHDVILSYSKSNEYTFNVDAVREPYHPNTVKTFSSSPKAGFGKVPNLVRGKVPEDWWYFPVVARLHNERSGYPTQKPGRLLERILLASSNPGDLVADFFCGSGTFPVIAAQLGRHFLAGDVSWRATHTTRKRLLEVASAPFSCHQDRNLVIPSASLPRPLEIIGNSCSLHGTPPLDYWEMDPAWDGSIFNSVCQSWRSNHSSEILLKMKSPVNLTNASVRAITVQGDRLGSHV